MSTDKLPPQALPPHKVPAKNANGHEEIFSARVG